MKGCSFRRLWQPVMYGLLFLPAFLVLSWLMTPMPDVFDFAVSPVLLDRDGRVFHARLSAAEEWLLPVPLSEMGPWLPKMVVAVEDRRFADHAGIDFRALARAVAQNLRNGRVVSGASTIPAQLARLADPKPRSLFHKYIEFIQALKISRALGKDEVLELYLNRAPFGGNIRGVGAAARAYFNKELGDMSLGECALLTAMLRGPGLYNPGRRPELVRARRDAVLDRLQALGLAEAGLARVAKAEPVLGLRYRQPRQAWHLAEMILAEPGNETAAWRWRGGQRNGLATSLDPRLQDQLELRLNQGLRRFPERITAAGAVMDNRSGEILAYVGNARRGDGVPTDHWVDCALAPRSSGSTLKPFVYLEAFRRLQMTPASLLADTPLALSGQAPRNFDLYYRGPVSARLALAESLNAPAVRVLRRLGHRRALAALRTAGFDYLGGRYYGDSLVLGGGEVNVPQLLAAYGALARQGLEVRPTWRRAEPSQSARRLFPSGPAWLVNQCLTDDRRLNPAPTEAHPEAGGDLAFKTGTSHGLRDAWIVGYSPLHTMVLWAGDPAGAGHPDLAAARVWGTVLPRLAAALPGANWPPAPPEVENYEACALSGAPTGPHCPASHRSWRLKEPARRQACRLHRLQEGQVTIHWPPDLADFMAAQPLEQMAGLSAGLGLRTAFGPVITSPLPGDLIVLSENSGRLPLVSEGTRGLVHWFVDEEFFQAAEPGSTPVLSLTAGHHQVSLIDQDGRSAAAVFEVKYSRELDRDRDLPVLSF